MVVQSELYLCLSLLCFFCDGTGTFSLLCHLYRMKIGWAVENGTLKKAPSFLWACVHGGLCSVKPLGVLNTSLTWVMELMLSHW